MTQYLVFLGAAVSFAGGTFYIKETLSGRTKPNRVTWLMWAIAPLIATSAALADGIRLAALPVFMSGFIPLLVFLASFANSKAYWKLEKFDYFCGASSFLALILWIITKEPVIAIIFAIASDGFAALPTIIKSWKHPDTESTEIFVGGLFNASTAFFALKTFDFSGIAFPMYLLSVNSILIVAGYRGRWAKRNLP